MTITFSRISTAIVPDTLAQSCVIVVGCGGSHHFVTNLARCGVGRFVLVDPDNVGEENICRTDHVVGDVGGAKVCALARAILDLGLNTKVEWRDDWVESVLEFRPLHGGGPAIANDLWKPTLIVAATDSFAAQAFVNRMAVRERWPALFMGLSEFGLGGEIVFWRPGLPCFRCLMAKRYEEHPDWEFDDFHLLDPVGGGATIFDTDFVDAVAGQIALGLLLRGISCRFGQMLDALGDRNFLRLKIDHTYALRGRDLVREELDVAPNNASFFGWCVSVQRDPDRGSLPCPDCEAAGHQPYHESSAETSSRPPSLIRA